MSQEAKVQRMCSITVYAPTRRAEEEAAVTGLLMRLDGERPLSGRVSFADRTSPWRLSTPPTCLVARRGDQTPVGFLSGQLARVGTPYDLIGTVGFVEFIGVIRGHGCTDPDGSTLGERLINDFTLLARNAGSAHLVTRVGANDDEASHAREFFMLNGFADLSDSSGFLCRKISN